MLQVAGSRAAATLSEFTAQALTNLFWAFAAIGDDPGGASARHFPALPSADLLVILCCRQACADAAIPSCMPAGTQCLAAMVQEVSRRMPELSTQQLGLIIWSFGKLHWHPGASLLEVSPYPPRHCEVV